ncbi:MAG: hypothetical protein ABJA37_06215 [Ferruginibacter sp.]
MKSPGTIILLLNINIAPVAAFSALWRYNNSWVFCTQAGFKNKSPPCTSCFSLSVPHSPLPCKNKISGYFFEASKCSGSSRR